MNNWIYNTRSTNGFFPSRRSTPLFSNETLTKYANEAISGDFENLLAYMHPFMIKTVLSVSKKMNKNSIIHKDDLMQEAFIYLVRLSQKIELSNDNKFCFYFIKSLYFTLVKFSMENQETIRLPYEAIRKSGVTLDRTQSENLLLIPDAEILDSKEEDVKKLLSLIEEKHRPILVAYFGLDGDKRKFWPEVSECFGIPITTLKKRKNKYLAMMKSGADRVLEL